MDDNSHFPETYHEALAYLYCEKHINQDDSPEELYQMYRNAQIKIINEFKRIRAEQPTK